jgi:hypothetical protein
METNLRLTTKLKEKLLVYHKTKKEIAAQRIMLCRETISMFLYDFNIITV